MNQTSDESIRAQLLGLTPSGDLLDLARQLREIGVESLLICRPGGQIKRVLTDRQIAQMATTAPETPLPVRPPLPVQAGPPVHVGPLPTVPRTRHAADRLAPARSTRNVPGVAGATGRPVDH